MSKSDSEPDSDSDGSKRKRRKDKKGPGTRTGATKSSRHSATTTELPTSHHSGVMGLQGHHSYPPLEHTQHPLHSKDEHGHHKLPALTAKVHTFGSYDICVGNKKVSGQTTFKMCLKLLKIPPVSTFLPCLSHGCQLLLFIGHSSLSLVQTSTPTIRCSGQVLAKAASVNPLDVMSTRYGREVLDSLRKVQMLIALVSSECQFLGRDLSSVMWAATFSSTQGSCQKFCVADQAKLTSTSLTDMLSYVEATRAFTGLPAWAAIKQAGFINSLLGPRGGLGGIAIQTQLLAKQFQYEIVVVPTGDAHQGVVSRVLDYAASDYLTQLASFPPLQLVLDWAGRGCHVLVVMPDYSGQVNGCCLSPALC